MERVQAKAIVPEHSSIRSIRQQPSPLSGSALKSRQSQRIREVREALLGDGLGSLDQQARALGLSRSTAWFVLRGNHKASGLQATLVARMLTAPRLPPTVRSLLMTYIREKLHGSYGHSELQRRRFASQLAHLNLPKPVTEVVRSLA
jgi:hypothetical protein